MVYIRYKSDTNADSGCLGFTYRRRTRMAAISVGEESRSFVPAVSEWRNPTSVIAGNPIPKLFSLLNIVRIGGEPPELKHLSKVRKINQTRLPE